MATDSSESRRVSVQTYLPEYQREKWDAHADELDMSRSEFVKAMVQAGRCGFDGESRPSTGTDPDEVPTEDSSQSGTPASAGGLENTVIEALDRKEHLSWDELLAAVTDDIEARLENTLQKLQSEDTVRYSGRHGGYTLDS
jgi:hypothetical protein